MKIDINLSDLHILLIKHFGYAILNLFTNYAKLIGLEHLIDSLLKDLRYFIKESIKLDKNNKNQLYVCIIS